MHAPFFHVPDYYLPGQASSRSWQEDNLPGYTMDLLGLRSLAPADLLLHTCGRSGSDLFALLPITSRRHQNSNRQADTYQ